MESKLTGKYFHSFKDGKVNWQGQVLDEVVPGTYGIQLFEWLSGHDSDELLIPVKQMVDESWVFYKTDEEMRDTFNIKYART
jgi:hypothetical protein